MGDQLSSQAPAANAPVPAQQAPAPLNSAPADGGNSQGDKVTVDAKEFATLKANAGRWESHQKRNSGRDRSRERTPRDNEDELPDRDAEILKRDETITELRLKDRVRDLLDSDDYKDLPQSIKRIVARNPKALVRDNSRTLEHFVQDIEDYLSEELDAVSSSVQPKNVDPVPKPEERPTPPVSGSGPASQGVEELEDLSNLRGPARSMAAFRNIVRKQGKK